MSPTLTATVRYVQDDRTYLGTQGRGLMDSIVYLFIELVVAILVFGLLYWLITLVVAATPAPMKTPVNLALTILLVLLAILFLLGIIGVWGTWGYHAGPIHRW